MRLADEHEAFRTTVRSLVDKEINPHIDQWEREGGFPAHELFPRLAQFGLLGLEYDPAYGGEGADHLFTFVACEEYGRIAAAGVAMAIGVQTVSYTHLSSACRNAGFIDFGAPVL